MEKETINELLEESGIIEVLEKLINDKSYVQDIITNDDILIDKFMLKESEYIEDDGYVDGEDEDGLNPSYGEIFDWDARALDYMLEEHKEEILKVIATKFHDYLNDNFDIEKFKNNF